MERSMIPERHNLQFNKTITQWDEAIPLGNGHLGALIWGEANALRFSLDRADIWDTIPFQGIFEEDFNYQHMLQLVKEGNGEEIRRKFSSIYQHMTPCKLPAGKLILKLNTESNVESRLSLAKAKADIRVGAVHLESFIHAGRKFGVLRVNLPLNQFSYYVENSEFGIDIENTSKIDLSARVDTASLKNLYYPAPEKYQDEKICYFIQTVNQTFAYGVFVAARQMKGSSLLAFGVSTSKDGENWKEEIIADLMNALETGYEKLFEEHCNWWSSFWRESELSLPNAFMEHNWYLTNYLLASCSRKGGYPMQLQGLWTADDGYLPPWKGDYHHDLNTQMSYFSYLKANHLEEGESFLDFLWEMADEGKKFAKSFYHTDGMCLPSIMDIDGTALGGWAMYAFSPTNQIWLCQSFERYYCYTGDKKFLQEKAYPYMKEVGECITGLLEEKEGKYYLPISSSPEIHDDTIDAFLTPNSNYDLALMRYLFTQLTNLAQELGYEEADRWQEILKKLPQLAVNEQDVMMLSPNENLKESHRHFSHLMGIHPLRLLDYHSEEGKRIIDASIHQLEILGTGYWVGYTFSWMAELYAIQGNGNGAAHQLCTFWNCFCSQNGFHLNGDYKNRGCSQFHYRPFTLEGNMCAADALQEMLLQSEKGIIDLFPAIPDEWMDETVSFKKFRAEGGVLVSAVLEKGQVVSLELDEVKGQEVKVRISPYLQNLAAKRNWQIEGNCYVVRRPFPLL